jgi:hypothetical protein
MRWCADLLSAFGIVKFENYRHDGANLRLWESRAAFVRWERACELRYVVGEWGARRDGQEMGDLEEAVQKILDEWEGEGGKKKGRGVEKEREEDGEWEVWEEAEGGGGKGRESGPMRVLAFARRLLEEKAKQGQEAGRRREAMRQALGEVVVLIDDDEEGEEGEEGAVDCEVKSGIADRCPPPASSEGEAPSCASEGGVPSFLSSFDCECVLVELLSDVALGGGGYSRRLGAGESFCTREERMAVLRLLLQLDYCVHKRGRW